MAGTKLELTRPGKNKAFELEPRILIEKPELSYGDPNTENMLIHGDNLLALKALEQQFSGKIKCIYIDPPYNTGSAFEHYEDGLEHSDWLNLMKPRLELLRNLLADDGLIFVQIDDNEQAYLKVLMDEIFGRNNFVNCIAIKMSPSSGVKRRFANIKFIKNKEFILVYKKRISNISPIYDTINEYDGNYSIFYDGKELCSLSSKVSEIDKKYADVSIADYLKFPEIKNFIMKNKDNIFRRHGHSKWVIGNINDDNLKFKKCEELKSRTHIWEVHNPSNRDEYELIMNTGTEKKVGYERLEPISRKVMDNELTLLRGDFWDGYDADMGNVSKEGIMASGPFGEGQKPERLISDILKATTNPGDIVMDSFLGSGTTVAVAHKMGRKYIGIELGEQCYTYCKVRLDNIIDGEQTGVSSTFDWQGGGGYKFYELGPSVLLQDKYGNYIINPNFNSSELVQAICKIENFTYKAYEDSVKHGYSTEKDFIHVTTRHITQEIIKDIQENSLKEGETMLIVAKTFESNLDLPSNIQIKKIPTEILDKCEYNKDNYSLPISKEEITDED